MQYIQEACLVNLVTNAIFTHFNHKFFEFTWDRIGRHGLSFNTDYNHDDAQALLQLSLMVTESNYLEKSLNTPSWLHDVPLLYDECPLPIISQISKSSKLNKSGLLGHIFYSEGANILFIIFTGTINGCMVALDIVYGQTELEGITNYTPGLKGHRGVYLAYKSIRDQLVEVVKSYLPAPNARDGIAKNPQIIISGHSLGGAVSQLCALDLAYYDPIHYSFAAPMIFNEHGYHIFNNLVKYSYRIANISDLVVLSPLPVMPNKDAFFHVGKLIHFQRNMGEYPLNHGLAYAQEYNLV